MATENERNDWISIEESITVRRPIPPLFEFWRNFANLPRFLKHIRSVRVLNSTESIWEVAGPFGKNFSWKTRIVAERRNALIEWKAEPTAPLPNAGCVRFARAETADSTLIDLTLRYAPPGGILARSLASLFLADSAQQIRQALRAFKRTAERAELAA
ncbi:MAG: SRPBCC family protein [Verrucomicrobiae bacterium]|nr:SRPBCC family protein [Verrucomicrobiae bacterium]